MVCRHTLEVLISLAKSFPGYFLPWKETDHHYHQLQHQQEKVKEDSSGKSKGSKSDKKGGAENSGTSDFWDTLLRLDQLSSTSKKGKSVVRSHSSVSGFKGADDEEARRAAASFDASIFGQLLSMLSSPVIRRNSVLTDKLLRLLSLISVGQPDFNKRSNEGDAATSSGRKGQQPLTISAEHLKLAVEVLTSKACSEEGLEDVNALLLNLSYGPEPTRDTILRLLLQGAQQLGSVVRENVMELQTELRKLKEGSVDGGSQQQDPSADATKQVLNRWSSCSSLFYISCYS